MEIDGAKLRAFRLRWGVTQTQLAKWLSLRERDDKPWQRGEGTVSQRMVDQIERGIRPAPSKTRYLGEEPNPSVAEMLAELLADDDQGIREWLTVLDPAPRGAYRARR